MSKDGMSQHEVRKYLPAFADGELDVEQNLQVLEQMAMDPTNTRRVLHQQQLRKACAAAMDQPEYRCPDQLQARITALASAPAGPPITAPAADDDAPDQNAPSPVLARIGQWMPAAVAAVLLLGALAVFFTPPSGAGDGVLVSNWQLDTFPKRHVSCKTNKSVLHGLESPNDVAALPGTIDDYFGDNLGKIGSALDLSVMGYDFQRVGVCSVPGKGAVQVLYHAKPGSEHQGSISLWIKPDKQKLGITPGVLHTAQTDAGQPVLIWKRDGRIYYLFGDTPADTQQAAQLLRE